MSDRKACLVWSTRDSIEVELHPDLDSARESGACRVLLASVGRTWAGAARAAFDRRDWDACIETWEDAGHGRIVITMPSPQTVLAIDSPWPHAPDPDFRRLCVASACTCGADEGPSERHIEPCARRGFWVTPRFAFALYVALCLLYDQAREGNDLEEIRNHFEGSLPPVAVRTMTEPWVRRYVKCYADLAQDLATGGWPTPRCTGDEMALHEALTLAQAMVDDDWLQEPDDWSAYPTTEWDEEFELGREVLLQDADVELLFSYAFDGIEDDDDPGKSLVNLHPGTWFDLFRNIEPRW